MTLGAAGLPEFSATGFAPRKATSFIDSDAEPPLALFRFGASGLFVDPPGDSPVILCGGSAEWGRFADSAVVILFGAGTDQPARLEALTRLSRPRLVAIATGDFSSALFADFATALQGTPLQIMEPGLALEA